MKILFILLGLLALISCDKDPITFPGAIDLCQDVKPYGFTRSICQTYVDPTPSIIPPRPSLLPSIVPSPITSPSPSPSPSPSLLPPPPPPPSPSPLISPTPRPSPSSSPPPPNPCNSANNEFPIWMKGVSAVNQSIVNARYVDDNNPLIVWDTNLPNGAVAVCLKVVSNGVIHIMSYFNGVDSNLSLRRTLSYYCDDLRYRPCMYSAISHYVATSTFTNVLDLGATYLVYDIKYSDFLYRYPAFKLRVPLTPNSGAEVEFLPENACGIPKGSNC